MGLFLRSLNLVVFAEGLMKSFFPEYEVMVGKLEDAEGGVK
jgi:hypothetical protein